LLAGSRLTDTRLVWDLPVRVMHWMLALAVVAAWVSGQAQGAWFPVHVACGYTALVIVLTRIIWGFVGTRHARFANFLQAPRAIALYTRKMLRGEAENAVGHNPLGALMVLLLLALLLAQGITGLFSNDQVSNVGPLFGYVGVHTSDRLAGIHRTLSTVILASTFLHIGAAFGYWSLKRQNLIWPMLTGRKAAESVPPDAAISTSRIWLALLIATAIAIILRFVINTAPPASLAL
jgi:cytochrome b